MDKISYCRDCPYRNAKKKKVEGNDQFFFTPISQIARCLECNNKRITSQMESLKRAARLDIKK